MGLFGRRNRQSAALLPRDIVPRMEYYGRFEFEPQGSPPDAPAQINELIYQPLASVAAGDPDAFIGQLASAVLPVGGWAVYGGERCVRDLISHENRHPGFVAMVDAAISFLRSRGYGWERVAPYERAIWADLHDSER